MRIPDPDVRIKPAGCYPDTVVRHTVDLVQVTTQKMQTQTGVNVPNLQRHTLELQPELLETNFELLPEGCYRSSR